MLKRLTHTLTFLLFLLLGFTAAATYCAVRAEWLWAIICGCAAGATVYSLYEQYNRNARKIAFMFDAIDNDDFAFKFPASSWSGSENMVSHTLNRIKDLLLKAKADAVEKEKYYELILNCVNTGVLVIDEKGNVIQHNNEALRLLGIAVLTHVAQLNRIDERLAASLTAIQPGEKVQVSFMNERGNVCLSIRASEIVVQQNRLRIVALNDIDKELDEKEIDSWIRLTRVLTHEIMNSVTPITSLSDTLLEIHGNTHPEIRHGLEVIGTTGKNLMAFVDSYRRFTRIPTPEPTLFYVRKFVEQMADLGRHHNRYPNISIRTDVQPDDLILYADEKLVSQVMLNLLKNAVQAIGTQPDGRILVKAYCSREESVIIEVTNNGPLIPPEVAEHIFIPFFTTKEGGSGIGLSLSRQIMRLSGGSISLKSSPASGLTAFILTFK